MATQGTIFCIILLLRWVYEMRMEYTVAFLKRIYICPYHAR